MMGSVGDDNADGHRTPQPNPYPPEGNAGMKASAGGGSVNGAGRISIDLLRQAPMPSSSIPAADGTRAMVFAEVLSAGPVSRTDLARRLGVSQSTVTKAVNPLISMGYLIEAGEKSSGVGRPQRLVQVARERHLVIGVKIAPRHVTGVLTDLGAAVLARARRPLDAKHRPRATLNAARAVIGELVQAQPRAAGRVLGVGVGVGGHVDGRRGRVVHSGVMGWDDVDVAAQLTQASGLATVVSNDVDALVIAEQWFGAGRTAKSFVVVTVGPGIGGGLLLGGQLYVGKTGLAGELGHLPLQVDGPPCSCGNNGCLEALASDDAVLRDIAANTTAPPPARIDEAYQMARDGHPAAVAAFQRMGDALGRGLAAVCNLLNPEKIVLTGEGAHAFDLFGPACTASLAAHAFSTAAEDCELVIDTADDDMWARGAACLVIQEAVGAARS
ncbi:ROK family protein [Micromonospora sp. NPDC048930]|uniref:ROK family protein n=1 Tax=Micromonospora sp. NPDC048930 TaxID=3364261 RepID=UPI003713D08B